MAKMINLLMKLVYKAVYSMFVTEKHGLRT